MRRVTSGPALCGWCSSGKHLPSETSRGCTRYRDHDRPCSCAHPAHAHAAEGAPAA